MTVTTTIYLPLESQVSLWLAHHLQRTLNIAANLYTLRYKLHSSFYSTTFVYIYKYKLFSGNHNEIVGSVLSRSESHPSQCTAAAIGAFIRDTYTCVVHACGKLKQEQLEHDGKGYKNPPWAGGRKRGEEEEKKEAPLGSLSLEKTQFISHFTS